MNCAYCNKKFESKAWNAQCCSGQCNLKKWRRDNPEHSRRIKREWRRKKGVVEFGSPEHRQKVSERLSGRSPGESTREKMRGSALRGKEHPLWRGDKVGYRALHRWIEGQLGKPDKCEHCLSEGLTGRQIHWANKSHQYKRKLDDWKRLCSKCHKAYDKGVLVWE